MWVSSGMACLYLRYEGWRSTARYHWPGIEAILREHEHPALWGAPLRRNGYWEEAAILEDADRFWLASLLVAAGLVLTVGDAAYPDLWRRRLHLGAPPAVWICGGLRGTEGQVGFEGGSLGFVGSRELKPAAERFGFEAARAITQRGLWLVSGGARGADSVGARGVAEATKAFGSAAPDARRLVTILASGFESGQRLGGSTSLVDSFAKRFLEGRCFGEALGSGSGESTNSWLNFVDRLGSVRATSTVEGLSAPRLTLGPKICFEEWLQRGLFSSEAISELILRLREVGQDWARASLPFGGIGISLAMPGTRFSVGLAMERNALIYAMSMATFVLASGYNSGGTWAGATDALRRRLCPVLVADLGGKPDPAMTALVALGADRVEDIPTLLERLTEIGAMDGTMSNHYGLGLRRRGFQVSDQLALFS